MCNKIKLSNFLSYFKEFEAITQINWWKITFGRKGKHSILCRDIICSKDWGSEWLLMWCFKK